MRKNTAWGIAPYLRAAGTYTGTVVRLERMERADGCRLLVRINDTNAVSSRNTDTAISDRSDIPIPDNILARIHKEKLDAEGSVNIGIYFAGWKYLDDGSEETEIEELLSHIRPGHRITFRMSANWRGTKYYCRYIRNEVTGEWAGYQSETDWRQKNHPYTPLPTDVHNIILRHAEPVELDDGWAYSMEISPQTEKYKIYRAYIPAGTAAYQAIKQMDKEDLKDLECHCTATQNLESGKSYITNLEFAKFEAENKKAKRSGRPKSTAPHVDYRTQKKIADAYPKIPNAELEKTRGIYSGVVAEHDVIDFSKGGQIFFPFLLDDGRTIMPELRVNGTKAEFEILEKAIYKTDLLRNKKLLYPGLRVTLYFSPSQKFDSMILRAVLSQESEKAIQAAKKKYLNRLHSRS